MNITQIASLPAFVRFSRIVRKGVGTRDTVVSCPRFPLPSPNVTMKHTSPASKTRWHHLLGKLLEELLTPVNISVFTDFAVMSDTPQADLLLLRRSASVWTAAQLARLPDGIRDCQAGQILIEFKYTESFNEKALLQALGYDTFYKRAKDLTEADVQTFLVVSKTSAPATVADFGYEESPLRPGVFYTPQRGFRNVILMSLNELTNAPHNAFFKCFTSRRQEKRKAFELLKHSGLRALTLRLEQFLAGLWEYWFQLKGEDMKIELTPEQVIEMGKMWGDVHLSLLPVEQRLAGLTPHEVLSRFKPEERVRGLTPQDVLSQFNPEDIERYLNQIKHPKTKQNGPSGRRS